MPTPRTRRPPARARKVAAAAPPDLAAEVLATFALSQRMNRLLIESLDDAAWNAEPPGGKGRTIAAIVAHVHNVRHMWLVACAPGARVPAKLDRHRVTRRQALAALDASHEALAAVIGDALASGARLRNFPAGAVRFAGYHLAHEAHHRGQIASLARLCGHPIPQATTFALWEWGKRG